MFIKEFACPWIQLSWFSRHSNKIQGIENWIAIKYVIQWDKWVQDEGRRRVEQIIKCEIFYLIKESELKSLIMVKKIRMGRFKSI